MTILYIIIALTVLISIWGFNRRDIFDKLRFSPYSIKHNREGWRFFTYAFLHADWVHLFINMFVLYSFGDVVLAYFTYFFGIKGFLYFVLLYLGGILFSVVVDFGRNKDNAYYTAVGASGAVSAIVFASIMVYPTGSIYLFFIPIPIPSAVFGILYLVYSAYMARRGKDNIGHNAHFWGAIFGILFIVATRPVIVLEFIQKISDYLL
ncbi:MAG: rhomboid family intramembrane serine protease [Bacteroidetes bacterium]|nr:rhomboid family intramembrane serine protease [Bacteroidota bacterium]